MEAKAKRLDYKNHTRSKTSTILNKHTRGSMGRRFTCNFQLMNDVINVVSFKCSIDNNKELVNRLELQQQQGWQIEIEKQA